LGAKTLREPNAEEKNKNPQTMSMFDVQIKKIADTWVTRQPWQSGTDGQLLKEIYEIHQKWGLASHITALEAIKHVFNQDVLRAQLIEVAKSRVEALRKAVKETEKRATEDSKDEVVEITEAMVLQRVKENQNILLNEATQIVGGMEAEIPMQATRSQQERDVFTRELKEARDSRAKQAREIHQGS